MLGLENSKPVDLSFPAAELPEFDINSHESSPTRRTLNNRKILDTSSYYNSSPWGKNEVTGLPLVMPLGPRGTNTPIISSNESKLKRSPQKAGGRNVKLSLSGSPHRKGPRSTNNLLAKSLPKYKEISSIYELDKVDPIQQEEKFVNRYFSDPVDLDAAKSEDGRLKPIINTASKNGKSHSDNKVYKLSIPLLVCQDTHRALKNQIERVYRSKYHSYQPLCLFGDTSVRYYRLEDLQSKFIDFLQKPGRPQPPLQVVARSLNGTGALNDSFDLSFDGKALDRSDIFRMVDSFSIAPSDDDSDNEGSFLNPDRNILPAEMTGTVF